jgi:hypothetical protein
VLILLLIPISAYATHQSLEKSCSVSIDGQLFPVLYDEQPRNNPDGSFYPGDASHFVFKFKGSETCQGFNAESIKSNGAIDVLSHYVVMGPSKNYIENNIHSHNDLDVVPKYLKTTHYYKKTVTDVIKHGSKGGGNNWYEEIFTLSDKPLLSIREDHEPTKSQLKKINKSGTHYRQDDIITKETFAWGFSNVGLDHSHGNGDHLFEDTQSITNFNHFVRNSCSNLIENQGCVFGHVEIDTEIVKEKCLLSELKKLRVSHNVKEDICVAISDELSLTVSGNKVVCDDKKCKTVIVKKTKNLISSILEPVFDLILEQPPLKDRDYYDAKNMNGTFYLHDPVTITHNPTLLWKESRDKTIQFETTKTRPIILEDDFDCNENECDYVIPLNTLHPTSHNFVNGQGMSIFNATSDDEITLHEFSYHITAFNLDREIGFTTASTVAKIVNYNPQLNCHPYPLLKDNFELTYDDRQAAACHYLGNLRDGNLYPGERSKINYSYNAGIGYDPHIPKFLNQNFTFSDGHNFSDPLALESYNGTAMFIQEGYGKLYFEYPLGEVVFDDNVPQYQNVTSFTTLYSDNFAAKTTILEHYSMRYPENPFTKNLVIKNVNQNGTIIDSNITLEVKPYDTIDAEYIREYIFDKIKFDTSDETFAEIISDDTYPMYQKYSGNGILNVTISKTSIFFDEHEKQMDIGNKNFSGKLNDLPELIQSPDTLRLSIPYDIGLSSLSPTRLIITVGDIANNFDERYFSYGGTMHILVNTQKDNILKIERSIGKIIIHSPANFGQITAVYVDGNPVKQECKFGCVLLFQPEKDLKISVENRWGGIASVDSAKIHRPEIPISQDPDYRIIVGIIVGIVMGYFVWSRFRVKK